VFGNFAILRLSGLARQDHRPHGTTKQRLQTAGFDDGHLDAEFSDLNGEGLAESLESPLRGMIEAIRLKGVDPADR